MSWTVPAEDAGERLVDVAHAHLAVVRRRAVGPLIAAGDLLVDGAPGRIAQRLAGGETLTVAAGVLATLVAEHAAAVPSAHALTVVHEDDRHLVVDKPAGLHVAPTGGRGEDAVTTRLLHHAGARPDQPWAAWRPYPVHRLDRVTSGLLLVAKDAATAGLLQEQLRDGLVHRTYTATVEGHVDADEGVVDAPLGPDPADDYRRAVRPLTDAHGVPTGAQPARTRWHVLHRLDDPPRTTLRLTLETGRTHQLRAHLASIGHPVLGDTLYGAATGPGSRAAHPAITLRATALTLPDPTTGALVTRTAPDSPIGAPQPAGDTPSVSDPRPSRRAARGS